MCATNKPKAAKGSHNFAAASKTYKVPASRKTPEGYVRGTEVEFDATRVPAEILTALYGPSFSLSKKYIVISVFQPAVNLKPFTEVTVRDEDGDCYGYIASHHLKKWGAAARPPGAGAEDLALQPLGLLALGVVAAVKATTLQTAVSNDVVDVETEEDTGGNALIDTPLDVTEPEAAAPAADNTPRSDYYPPLAERIAEHSRVARNESAEQAAKPATTKRAPKTPAAKK